MPPKFRFTRDEIIAAAIGLTREQGFPALTARALADRLGSSTKPIFGLFANMDEVQQAELTAADGLYRQTLAREMQRTDIPPYKGSGLGYIRFAMDEPELFRLLFMRDRKDEPLTEDRESLRPLLALIMQNVKLTEDEAYLFHLETWVFVHGIATMIATGYLHWDMDFASRALTDVYQGLIHRFQEGAHADGRDPHN